MLSSQSQSPGGMRNELNPEAKGQQTTASPTVGLRNLFGAIENLKKDTSYRELANVVKDVEVLRTELKSKATTIEQLELDKDNDRKKYESTTQTIIDEHHKRYTKLETHQAKLTDDATAMKETIQGKDASRKVLENQKVRMEEEIAKLKKDLDSSNAFGREERQRYLELERDFKVVKGETEQLKTNFKHSEGEINKLKEFKLLLEKKHNDMRQSLQSSDEELERVRGLAVKLKTEPLASTTERLDNLWREALYMVNKHFRFKLPETSEQTAELSKRFKDVSSRLQYVSNRSVPLPRQDSIAARNMRCALVLAWLMQLINSELFQPNYIVPIESGIRNNLLHEAMSDNRSESFRRAFLLSVFPDQQTWIMDRRATNICDSIVGLVEGIIDSSQAADLKSDLQGFTKLACTVWQAIQRLQDRFEPNMDYTVDDSIDWLRLPLGDSEGSNDEGVSAATSTSDEAVLVVFPRMYVVKDAEPKPVTPGIVLMKSQTATAAQEVRSEAPKSPSFGRGPLDLSRDDRRRDSLVMNDALANRNAATFLGHGVPDGQSR